MLLGARAWDQCCLANNNHHLAPCLRPIPWAYMPISSPLSSPLHFSPLNLLLSPSVLTPRPTGSISEQQPWLETSLAFKLMQSSDLTSDPRSIHSYFLELLLRRPQVSAPHGSFNAPPPYLQLLVLLCCLTSLAHYTPSPTRLGKRPVTARLQPSCCVSDLQKMLGGPTRIGERVLNSPRSYGQSGLN